MRKSLFMLLCLLPALCIEGCGQMPTAKPRIKDGAVYGVTRGAFRKRWWQYYQRGISFAEGHFWREAEADLRAALQLRKSDRRRKKTYGMHTVDYFPHRELGVVLFHQDRYEEALEHLSDSLSMAKSAKGEFYLDCVRKSIIMRDRKHHPPPELILHAPAEDAISNRLTAVLSGVARDDGYVRYLAVNDEPVRMDLAAVDVPFQVEVPLVEGENRLRVEARNLAGEVTTVERKITADWQGPQIILDEPPRSLHRATIRRNLEVCVFDASGIEVIRANGHETTYHGAREAVLDYSLPKDPGGEPPVIEAVDRAGNTTRVEIPANRTTSRRHGPLLLASLDVFGLQVASDQPPLTDGASPVIEVKSWTEVQEVFLDQIYLEGTASAEAGLQSLTVNGRPMLKKPGMIVSFSSVEKLNEGPNIFTIEAVDQVGRRSGKQLSFNRRLPDVRQIGSRLRVALFPLDRKDAADVDQAETAVDDKVLTALMDRRRFDLVERQRLEAVLNELKLSRGKVADPEASLRIGKILSADGLLTGSVMVRKDSVEIFLRLVDTETTLIVSAVDVYGEDVDAHKLRELCRGLVLKLCDELPLLEGTVVQVNGGIATTDLGQSSKVKTGMRGIIFREGEALKHPVTGAALGRNLEPLARGLIQNVSVLTSEIVLVGKEAANLVQPPHRVITR